MGYYTRYNIRENSEEIQQAIELKSGYSFYCGRTDEVKWYEWEKHCKEVSVEFPDTVIKTVRNKAINGKPTLRMVRCS